MYRAYKVSVPANVEPVTINEAKIHLKVDGSDEDSYIGLLISAAREWVERHTDSALMTQTIEDTWDCFPMAGDWMTFRIKPVATVVSIETRKDDGTYDAAWTAGDYQFNLAHPARLAPKPTKSWPTVTTAPGAVKLTYTAGYASANVVPPVFKQAILLLVGEMFEQRENHVKKLPTAVEFLLSSYLNWAV